MANRWCDGFGRYGGDASKMLNGSSSQAWAERENKWTLSNANPRTGSWHLRHNTTGNLGDNVVRRVFGAPLTEVFIGFAMYAHALPSTETNGDGQNGWCLGEFRDQSNGAHIRIMLGTDGAIFLQRGRATTLARSVPVIGAGAYQHVEIFAAAGNGTSGAFELRVDEVTRLNLTGIDTINTGNVEFSQFAQYTEYRPDTFPIIDFADYFCNDTVDDGSGCNDFVGDCKSGTRMVASDTAQADFALSSGASGYALLDETPPNDADYIGTGDATAESDFGIDAGPSNLTEILTVRPFDRAFKDDAGTCTLAPNMKESGGTKGTVPGQPIATAAAYYDSNVPLNPASGLPWTPEELGAAFKVSERTA